MIKAERNQEVISRIKSGETAESVAKEFGISQQRVCQICKNNGVKPDSRGRRIAQIDIVGINSMYNNGIAIVEIAENLGVSPKTISDLFPKSARGNERAYRKLLNRMKISDHGCWIIGNVKNTGKRPRISVNGAYVYAYRFVWEYLNGKIPQKMLICHKCDNPSCINPEHLFIGSHKDNAEDRENKGRGTKGMFFIRKVYAENKITFVSRNRKYSREDIYNFIVEYNSSRGETPKYAEIMAEFGITSKSVLNYILGDLMGEGKIKKIKYKPRCIVIV